MGGGTGILEENTGPIFFDTGYDQDADAFLFGTLEFTALDIGTVDLLTTTDSILNVNAGLEVFPTYAGVTVNVVEAIPEPSGALLIGSFLICAALKDSRRSRRR